MAYDCENLEGATMELTETTLNGCFIQTLNRTGLDPVPTQDLWQKTLLSLVYPGGFQMEQFLFCADASVRANGWQISAVPPAVDDSSTLVTLYTWFRGNATAVNA